MKDIMLSKLVKSETTLNNEQIKYVLKERMKKETSYEPVSETNESLDINYMDKLKFTKLSANISFKTDGKRAKIDVVSKQKLSGKAMTLIGIFFVLLFTGLLTLIGLIGFIFLAFKINGASKENTRNSEDILNYVQTELDFGVIDTF